MPPPPAIRGERTPPSAGRRGSAPARRPQDGANGDARKDTARTAYERGDDVTAIAKAAGVTTASIYNWVRAGKWKRPTSEAGKPDRPQPAAPAAAANRVEQLPGRVRCPSCETMTSTDPCDGCGKPLPRRW